jgi:hypothetical protein
LEQVDGRKEVVPQGDQQVDVVPVSAAAEAVGQIVSGIHRRSKFAASGTLKAEVAFDFFGNGTVPVELVNRDPHRQVVGSA